MSISWLWYFTRVFKDIVIRENWVKDILDHCGFLLQVHVHLHLSQNKKFNWKSPCRLVSHSSAASIQNVHAQFYVVRGDCSSVSSFGTWSTYSAICADIILQAAHTLVFLPDPGGSDSPLYFDVSLILNIHTNAKSLIDTYKRLVITISIFHSKFEIWIMTLPNRMTTALHVPQQMAHNSWFYPPKLFCLLNLSVSMSQISIVEWKGGRQQVWMGNGISENGGIAFQKVLTKGPFYSTHVWIKNS